MSDDRFSADAPREVFESAWFERVRLGRELERLLIREGVLHESMAGHFEPELQRVAAKLTGDR